MAEMVLWLAKSLCGVILPSFLCAVIFACLAFSASEASLVDCFTDPSTSGCRRLLVGVALCSTELLLGDGW